MSSVGSDPSTDDMDDAAGGTAASATGADTTAAGDDSGEEAASTTLFSVKLSADGTFMLIEGDEDVGEDGAASPDAGAAPEGKSFDSDGALLKAIADILKNAKSSAGGTDDDNFDAGYKAPKQPTPAA